MYQSYFIGLSHNLNINQHTHGLWETPVMRFKQAQLKILQILTPNLILHLKRLLKYFISQMARAVTNNLQAEEEEDLVQIKKIRKTQFLKI